MGYNTRESKENPTMAVTKVVPIDLTKLLHPYRGEWVALSHDEKRVVGHGDTIDAAVGRARKRGEHRPIIVRAPDQFSAFLL